MNFFYHGAMAHDGQSLDGHTYLANDPFTIADDADQDSMLVTNHRTRRHMIIPLASARWLPSHTDRRPGDMVLLTLYGEPRDSASGHPSPTAMGRKAVQVTLGTPRQVKRTFLSGRDLATWAQPVSLSEQQALYSWQWAELAAAQHSADGDISDGGLSTGCSSPCSPASPSTPPSMQRGGSLVICNGTEDQASSNAANAMGAYSFPGEQSPSSADLKGVLPYLDTSKSGDHDMLTLQMYPHGSMTPFPGHAGNTFQSHEGGLVHSHSGPVDLAVNNVQVHYMYTPDQMPQHHHQPQAPPVGDSLADRAAFAWTTEAPATSLGWQAGYPVHEYAPTAVGPPPPVQPEHNALVQQQPHPSTMVNMHRQLGPGQFSLVGQGWTYDMHDLSSTPVFYRTQEQHAMNLVAPPRRARGPPAASSYGSSSSRSHASDAHTPKPEPTPLFRPEILMENLRRQAQPHIDVLQHAQRGADATDDSSRALLIAEALQLVRSTVDETTTILKVLRPSGDEYKHISQRLRNEIDHILASVQATRDCAMDGGVLTEEARQAARKHVDSLKKFVEKLQKLDLNLVVPHNKGDTQQQRTEASRPDVSLAEAAIARSAAAVATAFSTVHWGQRTPPPDQHARVAVDYGQQRHAAFTQGLPSNAPNMHQAVTGSLAAAAPLPGFDPVMSGVSHPAMAAVMSSPTGPSPVTATSFGAAYPVHSTPASVSMDHLLPAVYPSPPLASYGENLASMHAATQVPSHSYLAAMHSPVVSSPVQAPPPLQPFPASPPHMDGRRGSVPERYLAIRERSRFAPYPMDRRGSNGRKGSV